MKYELVRNLKSQEILAKSVYDESGKILLVQGIKLTKGHISKMKQNLIYFVYIEEEETGALHLTNEVLSLNKLVQVKDEIIVQLPNIFNDLMDGSPSTIEHSLERIDTFIDSIIAEKEININLFELKKYDNYTYIHCIDTGIMAIILGRTLEMNKSELKQLGYGAMLHDIGKLKIDQGIINKQGKLTTEEFNEIRKHPVYGYNALKEAGIGDITILNSVISHHERVDGSGYPFGLNREKISLHAKIISVCDVFTAISADRSYRERFNPNEAYEYIIAGVDTYFDKDIVDTFKQTFSIYPLGSRIKLSNEVEGIVGRQNKGFPDRPVIKVYEGSNNLYPSFHDEIDLMEHINLTITDVISCN